ncbi:hypothetical protein XELAEV_18041185mg [Xenopus laevis]|uniref:Uncharacterized protein n=1 Tax=Xenopus laevis TaxID=8355 RepID=A0A974C1P8_XENLA|nr:hypothetical protein XELAEV_18041185mg [Xenopus laevis]
MYCKPISYGFSWGLNGVLFVDSSATQWTFVYTAPCLGSITVTLLPHPQRCATVNSDCLWF